MCCVQALEIVQQQDVFIFTVEATGALSPAEIVLTGALQPSCIAFSLLQLRSCVLRLTLSARAAAIDILKEKLDAVLSDIELTQGDDGGVMGL